MIRQYFIQQLKQQEYKSTHEEITAKMGAPSCLSKGSVQQNFFDERQQKDGNTANK